MRKVPVNKCYKIKHHGRCSVSFVTKVYGKYGDADVMTNRYTYIDAKLKFFYSVPLLITSNTHQKKGLDNGTRIIGLSIQLKRIV